jgi:hypothetical protein
LSINSQYFKAATKKINLMYGMDLLREKDWNSEKKEESIKTI